MLHNPYETAMLPGDTGHGKSYLLQTELNDVYGPGNWLLYNSDMSPPALLAEMEAHRGMAIVLEDCEQLISDRKNQGILRSAMAPPHRVNPKNMKKPYDFVCLAPIYILSNLPMNQRHGVLAAMASRTGPIWWHLTQAELAVRMKKIALDRDDDDLTVAERWEVAEYCIAQLNTGGRVDLRTLCEVGFPARLQHKKGELKIDWRDYIDSFVNGAADPNPERRDERINRERHSACEVYFDGKDTDDRHRLWEERKGLKKTAFRDRLREAHANGSFDQYNGRRKPGNPEKPVGQNGQSEELPVAETSRPGQDGQPEAAAPLPVAENENVELEGQGNEDDEEALNRKFQLHRTPPHITQAILRLEPIQGSILEPCVGKGDLVQELRGLPNTEVHWSDIHDWGFDQTEVQDFFQIEDEHYDCIITNPPHRKSAEFVRHAKTLADKMILLLPLGVELNVGWIELRNDKGYPLKAIYSFTQTIKWVGWKGNLWSTMKFGWHVFERGYDGPTIRKNITFVDGGMKVE